MTTKTYTLRIETTDLGLGTKYIIAYGPRSNPQYLRTMVNGIGRAIRQFDTRKQAEAIMRCKNYCTKW